MTTKPGRIRLEKLARLDDQLADIDAREAELADRRSQLRSERAKLYREMAQDGAPDIATGRRETSPHVPEYPVVSELDVARAGAALHQNALRRRRART